MRTVKIVVVMALLAAVTAPAGAITFQAPFQGPVRFIFESWDMLTVYDASKITTDTVHKGISTLNSLPQTSAMGAASPIPSGKYAGATEDQWGVLRVLEIRSDDGLSTLIWSGALDTSTELVGIVYGLVDNAMLIDTTANQAIIQSDGAFFNVYSQSKGTFNQTLGSGGRVGFNQYAGVGFDSGGNPLPGSSLVIEGVSTPGVSVLAGTGGPSDPPVSHKLYFMSASATGPGKTEMYIDVTGGAWRDILETNGLFDPPSPDADLFGQGTIYPALNRPTTSYDWDYTNDDPIRGFVIPEPLSLLAVTSGLGALAGYLKRRLV